MSTDCQSEIRSYSIAPSHLVLMGLLIVTTSACGRSGIDMRTVSPQVRDSLLTEFTETGTVCVTATVEAYELGARLFWNTEEGEKVRDELYAEIREGLRERALERLKGAGAKIGEEQCDATLELNLDGRSEWDRYDTDEFLGSQCHFPVWTAEARLMTPARREQPPYAVFAVRPRSLKSCNEHDQRTRDFWLMEGLIRDPIAMRWKPVVWIATDIVMDLVGLPSS